MEDSFDASLSSAQDDPYIIDLNNIGGRLKRDLHLPYRSEPYIIRSDVTVMPEVSTAEIYIFQLFCKSNNFQQCAK